MSDLKWQTVEELKISKKQCEAQISALLSKLNGQKVRLEWIEKYIRQKTPVELTIEQIEARLGHRVIIKGDV
jgi:hypothetical protein